MAASGADSSAYSQGAVARAVPRAEIPTSAAAKLAAGARSRSELRLRASSTQTQRHLGAAPARPTVPWSRGSKVSPMMTSTSRRSPWAIAPGWCRNHSWNRPGAKLRRSKYRSIKSHKPGMCFLLTGAHSYLGQAHAWTTKSLAGRCSDRRYGDGAQPYRGDPERKRFRSFWSQDFQSLRGEKRLSGVNLYSFGLNEPPNRT